MKRQNRGLDLSISGDELERDRIQLENNLQNTEISLRLSIPSEDGYGEPSSVEYPRHNSGPTAFKSFEIPSKDYDGDSQIHPWSYRTYDDGEVNPYSVGASLSTAAHHASALTLSAGLGGGRAARREVSLSGAEYDPDRPLQDMIAGLDQKSSIFDIEPSRSRYMGNPLVVDSTAELDILMQAGHIPPIASPIPSTSSASDSDLSPSEPKISNARPKLSDSLRRVSFSPHRPRSNPASPRLSGRQLHDERRNEPMPRETKQRADIFPPSITPQPKVRLQPPTPSNTTFASQSQSQFSKMARGITREIKHAQRGEASKPIEKLSIKPQQPTLARPSAMKQRLATPGPSSKTNLHLPDVTGLTSAVESPMKQGSEYYVYPGSPRETEARLITMLNTVQSKLQHLEEENGISRRRVRELELELDVCKRDVARERTRVLEREEIIVQQQRDASFGPSPRRKEKGKARAKDMSMNQEGTYQRYTEAVEGQKALEALITQLRSHLTRLTSELSSQRALLIELQESRHSDMQTIKAKSAEVERLSREVERLSGEVEVLRGVVEEGLKERRGIREAEEVLEQSNVAMSWDREDEDEEDDVHIKSDEDEDEESPEPFDPATIPGPSRNRGEKMTMLRADHGDFGSSNPGPSLMPPSQALNTEFERISAEVVERRSSENRPVSPEPFRPQTRRATVQDASDDERQVREDPRPSRRPANRPPRPQSPLMNQNRNMNGQGKAKVETKLQQHKDETPFPQIRGGHLERLFFSAPEHNARTCNVCCRRRRADAEVDEDPSWIPTRFRKTRDEKEDKELAEEYAEHEETEDEGFADEEDKVAVAGGSRAQQNGEQDYWRLRAHREGLPPQTVVARVIRELEDDFTHYKGFVAQISFQAVEKLMDFVHFRIYVELAEQYKDMDPVSDVKRRNLLAKHLREVVDILEQKGDQIAALYDLLTFKDKPVEESEVPSRKGTTGVAPGHKTTRTVSTTAVPSTSIGRSARPLLPK
ncbi:hypothetical protein H0H93_009733 [Arthromyces matolae]|nr:hypothetical protein H0H93_009733 [Arthromyces matolae]